MPIITGEAITDLDEARRVFMGKLVKNTGQWGGVQIGIVTKIVTYREHAGTTYDSPADDRLVCSYGGVAGLQVSWLDQGTWEVWDGSS